MARELAVQIGTNGRRDRRRHVGRRERNAPPSEVDVTQTVRRTLAANSDPAVKECEPMTPNRMRRNRPPTDAPARKDAPRVAHVFAYFITRYSNQNYVGPDQRRAAAPDDAVQKVENIKAG